MKNLKIVIYSGFADKPHREFKSQFHSEDYEDMVELSQDIANTILDDIECLREMEGEK